eukprot:4951937-Prymnesium_polylepis.1
MPTGHDGGICRGDTVQDCREARSQHGQEHASEARSKGGCGAKPAREGTHKPARAFVRVSTLSPGPSLYSPSRSLLDSPAGLAGTLSRFVFAPHPGHYCNRRGQAGAGPTHCDPRDDQGGECRRHPREAGREERRGLRHRRCGRWWSTARAQHDTMREGAPCVGTVQPSLLTCDAAVRHGVQIVDKVQEDALATKLATKLAENMAPDIEAQVAENGIEAVAKGVVPSKQGEFLLDELNGVWMNDL